jgi:glycosidase
MSVPYWVEDAVIYQIFPDRFANGDSANNPPNTHPWGSPPTVQGFQGGDLRGIIQHFDYLLDLGVNTVYLNPIFQSPSTHRYNITDYYKIDPKLGDKSDFQALLNVAHRNNVHVILDGVFNHCSRGFFAFSDILENQDQSPYKDWFLIKHFPVDAYSPGEAQDYVAWWRIKSMPKFNTANPEVRRYLMGVARYWIEQGADGWRLDVPNEIDDDAFWVEFNQTVKAVNPEAYLVGEIWEEQPRWVGNHHFDGLMNYPLREGILQALTGKIAAAQLADKVENLLTIYPREAVYAMYQLLGSHDTERVITLLGNNIDKVKLAFLMQFSLPGAPAIYYGDEIGLPGGKDPDCRRAFPWDEQQWNNDIRRWVQQLISLRNRNTELRRGDFHRLLADAGKNCYAFARGLGEEKIAVVLNFGKTRSTVQLPVATLDWKDGRIVHNQVGEGEFIVSGNTLSLTIPPFSGMWLK